MSKDLPPVNIPTKRREQVKARDHERCLRCGGRGSQWAHRRTRKVRDEHTHCSCNGVWMCLTCHHGWAHANPTAAREAGFIVSSYEKYPSNVPVDTWHGKVHLNCDGGYE